MQRRPRSARWRNGNGTRGLRFPTILGCLLGATADDIEIGVDRAFALPVVASLSPAVDGEGRAVLTSVTPRSDVGGTGTAAAPASQQSVRCIPKSTRSRRFFPPSALIGVVPWAHIPTVPNSGMVAAGSSPRKSRLRTRPVGPAAGSNWERASLAVAAARPIRSVFPGEGIPGQVCVAMTSRSSQAVKVSVPGRLGRRGFDTTLLSRSPPVASLPATGDRHP